jgi:hypothetical protein
MSIIIKFIRTQLRILLDFLKKITTEVIISFKYNNVEISFFNNNKDALHVMNIDYESYVHDLKDDDTVPIQINPNLLLEEIDKLPKNKFISLYITPGSNLMKIESTD